MIPFAFKWKIGLKVNVYFMGVKIGITKKIFDDVNVNEYNNNNKNKAVALN